MRHAQRAVAALTSKTGARSIGYLAYTLARTTLS